MDISRQVEASRPRAPRPCAFLERVVLTPNPATPRPPLYARGDNPSQSGSKHNDENNQPPHAESQVSSPGMRDEIGLRRHYGLMRRGVLRHWSPQV
jgi:hypothetical protein